MSFSRHQPPPSDTDQRFAPGRNRRSRSPPPHRSAQASSSSLSHRPQSYPSSSRGGEHSPPRYGGASVRNDRYSASGSSASSSRYADASFSFSRRHGDEREGRREEDRGRSTTGYGASNGEYRQPHASSSSLAAQELVDRRMDRTRYKDTDAPEASDSRHQYQRDSSTPTTPSGPTPRSTSREDAAAVANLRDVSGDMIPKALREADRRESWVRPTRVEAVAAPPRPPPTSTGPSAATSSNRFAQSGPSSRRAHSPDAHHRARSPPSRYPQASSSNRTALPPHSSRRRHASPSSSRNLSPPQPNSHSDTPPRPSGKLTRKQESSTSRIKTRRSPSRSPLSLSPPRTSSRKQPTFRSRSSTPPPASTRAVSRSPLSQSSGSSHSTRIPSRGSPYKLDSADSVEEAKKRKRPKENGEAERYDKKPRVSQNDSRGLKNGVESRASYNGLGTQSTYGNGRVAGGLGPNVPTGPRGAPTGPRALRDKAHNARPAVSIPIHEPKAIIPVVPPPLLPPPEPVFIAPPHLAAAIPTGPKAAGKFVNLKSTNKSAGVPVVSRVVGAGLKKFFPGDEEEEEVKRAITVSPVIAKRPVPDLAPEPERQAEGRGRNRKDNRGRRDDRMDVDVREPLKGVQRDTRAQYDRRPFPEQRQFRNEAPARDSHDDFERSHYIGAHPSSRQADERDRSKNEPRGSAAYSNARSHEPNYPQKKRADYGYERPPHDQQGSNHQAAHSESYYSPASYTSSSVHSPYPNDRHSVSDSYRPPLPPQDQLRISQRPAEIVAAHQAPSGVFYQSPAARHHPSETHGGPARYAPDYLGHGPPRLSRPSSPREHGEISSDIERAENHEQEGQEPEEGEESGRGEVEESLLISAAPEVEAPSTVVQEAEERGVIIPPFVRGSAGEEIYERLVQVGEGTYGKVYKARNVETGNLVALKRIRMEAEKDGFPVTAVREIKLLQSLRHPNVVDLIEMMVSKGHVYMVFEYVDHDLTGVLHHPSINFTPAHLKSIMSQFLLGLGFIHRRGVLHRDLKGSNILISKSGELKIADFGLARFYAKGRKNDYTNRVITQWYKPPELLFGATIYGAEVDMWSAGCIFLELFARRPVFQGQDEIHQLDVIFKTTGTPSVSTWPTLLDLPWYELVKPKAVLVSRLREDYSKWLTPAGLDVAEALLSLNPDLRPSSNDVLQMDYFTIDEPKAELPTMLSTVRGEWHEFESKKARKKRRDEGV